MGLNPMPTCTGRSRSRRADAFERLVPLVGSLFRAEADFGELLGEFLGEEVEHFLRFGRPGGVLDARVDVFGVLAEDDHVGQLGMLHGRRNAGEVLHGPEADIEVEDLPEGDVQRANAAAHGRGERTLDSHQVRAEGVERFVGEPAAGLVERLFAGEDFLPLDFALAAVGFLHGGVEDQDAGAPDLGAGAVAFDEGNDGAVGRLKAAGLHGDGLRGRHRGLRAAPVVDRGLNGLMDVGKLSWFLGAAKGASWFKTEALRRRLCSESGEFVEGRTGVLERNHGIAAKTPKPASQHVWRVKQAAGAWVGSQHRWDNYPRCRGPFSSGKYGFTKTHSDAGAQNRACLRIAIPSLWE